MGLVFFSLVIVEMTELSVLLAMYVWCVGNQLMNPGELIKQKQVRLLSLSVIVQNVRHCLVEIIFVSRGHVSFGQHQEL